MRIEAGGDKCPLITEVPDDLVYKDKGLDKSMTFTVLWAITGGKTESFGSFSLEPMPGCCGIVVSTASYIEPNRRGYSNLSRRFHELKAKVAKHFGYKVMIMTTQLRNFPEVIGAAKNGWKFQHAFRNTRTDNDIGIAIKDI